MLAVILAVLIGNILVFIAGRFYEKGKQIRRYRQIDNNMKEFLNIALLEPEHLMKVIKEEKKELN